MSPNKPPSLYDQYRTCIICDHCGRLKIPGKVCGVCYDQPILATCDQCGDDRLPGMPCLECVDAEIASDNHRETCGEDK